MQDMIVCVNDMIHQLTEILYYIRKKNNRKVYELSLSFIKKCNLYFETASEKGYSDCIEVVKEYYSRLENILDAPQDTTVFLEDIKKICGRRFLKTLSDLELYLWELNDGKIPEYYDKNMQCLKIDDRINSKKLYKKIVSAKKEISDDYELTLAETGDLSLTVRTKDYGKVNICSSGNPWQEALLYSGGIGDNYNGTIERIVVFGFGMGDPIRCMAKMYPESEIIVLENDFEQLRIAMECCDLGELLTNQNVNIILCENANDYGKQLEIITSSDNNENNILYKIWKPSVKTIKYEKLRNIVENYQVILDSVENMSDLLDANFIQNIVLKDEYVDKIEQVIKNKNVIIIAGGPSLDENLELLKKITTDVAFNKLRENVKIICVGKVSKKLISQGIIPDYIIITDAKPGTRWQLRGIENSNVPLIYISTAAANTVSEYMSKRYIALQEGVEQAEREAKEKNIKLYSSGGSVTTLALDITIRLGAKRVICIGTDMGYKGERTHAAGVGRNIANKNVLRKVEAVGGGQIYTSKTLDIYRRWIERRIENEKYTEFINSSDGARIKGMKEVSFSKIIEKMKGEAEDERKV